MVDFTEFNYQAKTPADIDLPQAVTYDPLA